MADTEDSRAKMRAYKRAWYTDNRARLGAKKRAWRAANPEKTIEASRKNHAQRREHPQRYAFTNQKDAAKRRKIEFLLTFDEWWAIWVASGKFERRGVRKGEYCMARQEDAGPYAVGNVRICLNEENKREAHLLRRGKPMSANRLAALARARAVKAARRHSNDAPHV